MIRRKFITLLGGAAAWPLAARAQPGDRVRRIGVLMALDENDPLMNAYLSAFTQALAGLGWADGRNVRMFSEIAPGLMRAAIMFNPDTVGAAISAFMPSFETAVIQGHAKHCARS